MTDKAIQLGPSLFHFSQNFAQDNHSVSSKTHNENFEIALLRVEPTYSPMMRDPPSHPQPPAEGSLRLQVPLP